MRAVWGSRVNHSEQMLALNNKTMIIEKLLARWKSHFVSLLNETSTVEQHAVDNVEQRPTQNWMYKRPDLDEVIKLSLYSATGSLLVQTDCIQKMLREDIGDLSIYFTPSKRHLGKLGSHCRLQGYPTSYHLWEGRQMRLHQLQQDFTSLHTKESVYPHTAKRVSTLTKDFLPEA